MLEIEPGDGSGKTHGKSTGNCDLTSKNPRFDGIDVDVPYGGRLGAHPARRGQYIRRIDAR